MFDERTAVRRELVDGFDDVPKVGFDLEGGWCTHGGWRAGERVVGSGRGRMRIKDMYVGRLMATFSLLSS